MTTRYSVCLEATGAAAAAHKAVLAALPEHFTIVEGGAADAALVSDAKARQGTRVLVAADPLRPPASDAIAIPALRFAPRLFAEAAAIQARSIPYSLYESVVRFDRAGLLGVRTGLLEQMAALWVLTGETLHLKKVVLIGEGYLAEGAIGQRGAAVALTGVASSSSGPAFTIRAVSVAERLEIEIDGTSIARPARVRRFAAEGATEGPLIHQNDHRLTWLAAHAELDGRAQNGYGGEGWRADVAEIMKVVP